MTRKSPAPVPPGPTTNSRSDAGIDVDARDPDAVIVVEHQSGTHVIGVIQRSEPCPGSGMSGTFWKLTPCLYGVFPRLGNPLMRRAVADPRNIAAMKVDVGAVLGVFGDAVRANPAPIKVSSTGRNRSRRGELVIGS